MQASKQRLPQVIRRSIINNRPYTTTTRKMSFFPRFIENEFAPARDLFRLMDDYASHVQTRGGSNGTTSVARAFRSFTPKFDVKETKEAYELHGELPGIEQKNINIEFTDSQTLTIKGRTEHSREEGTRPAGLIGEGQEQAKITDGNEKHYQKPSVEEEGQGQTQLSKQEGQNQEVQKSEQPQSKYWVSERSVGEFARTFAFPTRVDQDNVKASLKDGILSIVVPKAQAPTSKRINIE